MSKYRVHQVVKYSHAPGLHVITQLEEGIEGATYQIMPKNKFDNWIPEKLETFDGDSIVANVRETDLETVF